MLNCEMPWGPLTINSLMRSSLISRLLLSELTMGVPTRKVLSKTFVELQDTYRSIETYLAEDVHGTLARTYISLDDLGNALRRAADRSDNVTPR